MKAIALTVAFLSIVSASIQEKLSEGDRYFLQRHKDPEYVDKARDIYLEAHSQNPRDVDVLWRLARLYLTMGTDKDSKDERLYYYRKGRQYAKKAKEVAPGSADAHFWYGVSLSRILQAKGLVTAVSRGLVVRKEFEKAIELDPEHILALGGLAIWHFEAPGIAGGDVDKTISLTRKALGIDSTYTLLYVYQARAYIQKKNYAKARTALRACLDVEDPLSPADYHLDDRHEAKRLLSDIEGK